MTTDQQKEQHVIASQNTSPQRSAAFANIRTYGEILLGVLLVMYMIAFAAFYWYETNDLRQELRSLAHSIAQEGYREAPSEQGTSPYPEGFIVLGHEDGHGRTGYYEQQNAGQEYLVYADPGSSIVVAAPERLVNEELLKLLILLIILYSGQVLILWGWWSYLKNQIQELFHVT